MSRSLHVVLGLYLFSLTGGLAMADQHQDTSTHQTQDTGKDLTAFEWENRVILVFGSTTPRHEPRQLSEQVAYFRPTELAARDLVVLAIGDGVVSGVFPAGLETTKLDAKALRTAYGVNPDAFALVLIGKDGDVKHKSNAPVAADAVYEIIDAMPMRQREMQSDDTGEIHEP